VRAITIEPGRAGTLRLDERPEPAPSQGEVLVETLAVGVCGTDRELVEGSYGMAPPGRDRLVLGHESLGRVLEAPAGAGLTPGDLVVAIVRRPDPVPCPSCAVGEWDMCRNGLYTEHGIRGLDGFMVERFRAGVEELVRLAPSLARAGVLLEPASILAKAWDHLEHIGARSRWTPRVVVVIGAGTIGLLAALMAAQRGLEARVLDRVTGGPKPELVRALGASYHTGSLAEIAPGADVIIECTGVGSLALEATRRIGPNGIVCLTGMSSGRRTLCLDADALAAELVLENNVVFGTVNANRRHYEGAAEALARADAGWLEGLVNRRVPLERWQEAFARRADDVKVVLRLGG
jgi:threonine dehydrogenase-like Zn-dependent dehydrogenase